MSHTDRIIKLSDGTWSRVNEANVPVAASRFLIVIADATRRKQNPQSKLHFWAMKKLREYGHAYHLHIDRSNLYG